MLEEASATDQQAMKFEPETMRGVRAQYGELKGLLSTFNDKVSEGIAAAKQQKTSRFRFFFIALIIWKMSRGQGGIAGRSKSM